MKIDRVKVQQQLDDAQDSEEALLAFKQFKEKPKQSTSSIHVSTTTNTSEKPIPSSKVISPHSATSIRSQPGVKNSKIIRSTALVSGYSSSDDDSDLEDEVISLKRKPASSNLLGITIKRTKIKTEPSNVF
ncbi:unnamed protein product [Ambrosiozyma monospora]|uniref:Unnamed protein product n=1 Tax=Ambrosiozyma monospora TaxID=43982 RepID=A0ACB5T9L0_AMBMO|nr:unnamed protein product [Ambrosiozyma monospora]